MRPTSALALVALCASFAAGPLAAQGFSFSRDAAQQQAQEQATEAAKQQRISELLSTPCRNDLKGKKIAVVIGEVQSNGWIVAHWENYGRHYQAINTRLRALGLTTFTPEEIRRQIAQAEIDAYFRNDPDAALSAARRLGASFMLRGLITAQSSFNPLVRVNQVSVNMGFTLTGANGRIISNTEASSASYAGADVASMALTLVNEQADEVVAKLYSDYCRNAGLNAGAKPAPK
ncbi:MAG TPA: hypothetical protein VMU96_08625 [Casimicrobiaceae bacterium]|nr:hypothetical protein [Casimicrobiaceae bacterium]